MNTVIRRLRAIALLAGLWAMAWSCIGALVGIYQLYLGWPIVSVNVRGFASPFLAVVLSGAFEGAKGGAISGALFALVLLIAERQQSAANLTFARSAFWGVLGALLVPVTMLGIYLVRFPILLSHFPVSVFALYWAFLAVLGAVCALLTVWLARRGISPSAVDAAA